MDNDDKLMCANKSIQGTTITEPVTDRYLFFFEISTLRKTLAVVDILKI
jgi:hypothetical protein